jgi:KDO2-lipid IV(A) lauroyltransferase
MRRRKKSGWKRTWWNVRYQLAYFSVRTLFFIISFLPITWTHFLIVKIGGKIAWQFAGKYKKKMLDNLTLTFQDSLSEEEKRHISQKSFRHIISVGVEGLYFFNFYKEKLDPKIELEGRENLEEALTLGKGVIAVTAHLGNFVLLGAKLNASGFPFSVIINLPEHPRPANIIRQGAKNTGIHLIPLDPPLRCQKEILRTLRNGEIVGFVSDQNQKRGGVIVEFLGRAMAMPAGPAIYHLNTGAPILPIFILRKDDLRHKIVIADRIEVSLIGDKERDIFTITSQITKIIESYIRRYPEQWHWISKRRIRTKTRRKTFLDDTIHLRS